MTLMIGLHIFFWKCLKKFGQDSVSGIVHTSTTKYSSRKRYLETTYAGFYNVLILLCGLERLRQPFACGRHKLIKLLLKVQK
jgi:hypothetical protein